MTAKPKSKPRSPLAIARGKRIRAARKAMGPTISQKWVAEKLGVSQATISDIERGASEDPGGYVLRGLSKLLDLDIDDLTESARPIDPGPDPLAALSAKVGRIAERVDLLATELERVPTRQAGGTEVAQDLAVEQSKLRSRLKAVEVAVKSLKLSRRAGK